MDAPHYPFRSAEAKAEYLAAYEKQAELWPVPSETRTVKTSYGETFVRVSGSAGAPPLVLLHGLRSTSLSWIPNVAALSAEYRTYAPDTLNDFGRSVCTRPLEDGADFACWLDELFTGLCPGDSINLVGMSMGGWLAGQYLLKFPQRLKKVVWIAPGGTVLPVSKAFIRRLALSALPFNTFRKRLIFWLFRDLATRDATGRALVLRFIERSAIAARSFQPMPVARTTVWTDEELRSIQAPTLFLVGEHEKLYPADQAVERLNRVAPQIQTRLIPNAGHDLPIVEAERVNREILEFLK